MSLRDPGEARRYAERWTAYLQQDLAYDETAAFERECLEDPQACEELYRELNLDAALGTVRSRTLPAAPPRAARVRRRLLSLALIGGLGLSGAGVAWWASGGGAPSLPQDESRCRPLEPKGSYFEFPDRFLWTRESGARSYRFELRRKEDGGVHWATTVADTVLFLPADHRPGVPAGAWSWRVIPQPGSAGKARPSETAHFRVDG